MDPVPRTTFCMLKCEDFSDLPADILYGIFKRLISYKDLRSVSFVCRRFYRLTSRRDFRVFMINEVFRNLKGKKLEKLKKHFSENSDHNPKSVKTVIKFCSNQSQLVSKNATQKDIEEAEWKLGRVNAVYDAHIIDNCCERVMFCVAGIFCCMTCGCGGLAFIALGISAVYHGYTTGDWNPCPPTLSEEEEALLIKPLRS